MEQILALLEPLLLAYSGKLGKVMQILVFIGSFRVFLKPVVCLARTYVDFSPSKKDNEVLDKVMESKWYKAVSYLLDWFSSLKLPQK